PRAQDSLVKDPAGASTLHLVVLENGERVNKYIASGTVQLIQNLLFSFNKETAGAINISDASGSLQISSPYDGTYMIMATQEQKAVTGNNEVNEFHMRSLYTYGTLAFVVPEAPVEGRIIYMEGDKKLNENDPDLIQLAINTSQASDTVSFYGGRGLTDFQHQVQVGDLRLSLAYGSKIYESPFSLKLTDFKMEKYPGSDSPSSYSSDVVIQDNGIETPFKIYMNHVLDHSGYRFFQSSFHPDEQGTILSVNHDAWGTNITYIGYTLLFLGMFVTLFWKGTHFSKLNEQLRTMSKSAKVTLLCLSFLALGNSAFSQKIDMHGTNGKKEQEHHANDGHDHSGHDHAEHDHSGHDHSEHDHEPAKPTTETERANMQQVLSSMAVDAKSFASTVLIDPAHADRFGSLLVQDFDGRIEPINTLALEILRKVHGKERFHSLNANQFL
ncbi:MAG: cytochrome C biogenesis protein CcsB, partial [Sphingobacteriales bacterium]